MWATLSVNSVAVASSWCNAQVINDIRAIRLRLTASQRQAGIWHQLLARAVEWNAHGVQAKERGVSSLQTRIPIVLIVACMQASQTDFGGGSTSQ
jgi:hypothetical protein